MSTTRLAAASGGDDDVRARARAFLKAWRAGLRHWQPERAVELNDELEALAAQAESSGPPAVSHAALELSVYLSAFTDADTAPNLGQRESLERLVGCLAAAIGEPLAGGRTPVEHANLRQAFVLAPDGRAIPGFAEQLGQRGWLIRPFHDTAPLLLALTQVSPDLLAVDEAFADRTHSLLGAIQRRRDPHSEPAFCVILAADTDSERTQFALRAGADAVLTERDPVALVGRIETLQAQRRALEYRVLIVEDHKPQAAWFEAVMRLRGIVSLVCEEPAQVLERIAEFNPDLVVMDLHLPGTSGIEITRRIRERAAHAFLPIVFLSAEHDVDVRFEAIRAGADDFLTKPVKPAHLLAAVESRIKRARELRAGRRENRGERRGIFASRELFAREVLRASRDTAEHAFAVVLVAVDAADDVLRRIGFVNAGLLPQQLAAAIAAELAGSPLLCAWGELHFLVLLQAPDGAALSRQLEAARARLDARTWLSAESPLHLCFSLAGALVPPGLGRVEGLLDRVRDACRRAQQAGGARCAIDVAAEVRGEPVEDPRQRVLRALLQAPTLGSAAGLDFQPLLPVTGLVAGIYEVRTQLQPPGSTRIAALARAEYLERARASGLEAHAERQMLAALLDRTHERYATHRELQLQFPITLTTMLDASFAPWLAGQLRARSSASGLLALQVAVADIAAALPRARRALPDLQRAGVRLVLDGRGETPAAIAPLLDIEDFAFVKFAPAADDAAAQARYEPWASLVTTACRLGKIVIACDAPNFGDLAILVHLGVHYVQGDALAPWMGDWTYEFQEAAD